MPAEIDRVLRIASGVHGGIDALAAINVVVAFSARDEVVAILAHELVGAIGAEKRVGSLSAFDRCCHFSALHCVRSAGRLPSNFAHLGETPGRSAGRPEAFVSYFTKVASGFRRMVSRAALSAEPAGALGLFRRAPP